MNRTVDFEMDISALIDGELESHRLLPLLDALVRDEQLRRFYLDARALQTTLDGDVKDDFVSEEVIPVTDDIWDGIEQRRQQKQTKFFSLNSLPVKMFSAAAVILLLVGMWAGGVFPWQTPEWKSDVLQVELEANAGNMDEQRFMELTAELLRADRRYHRRMLEMMEAVNSRAFVREGTADRPPARIDQALNTAEPDAQVNNIDEGRNPMEITFW